MPSVEPIGRPLWGKVPHVFTKVGDFSSVHPVIRVVTAPSPRTSMVQRRFHYEKNDEFSGVHVGIRNIADRGGEGYGCRRTRKGCRDVENDLPRPEWTHDPDPDDNSGRRHD